MVQQEEPSEAINEILLRGVNDDENVRKTLESHMLSADLNLSVEDGYTSDGEEKEEVDESSKEELIEDGLMRCGSENGRSGKGGITSKKRNSS